MRNLAILTHFEGILQTEECDSIVCACLDEFEKTLFVYLKSTKLIGYKYGLTDPCGTTNLGSVEKISQFCLADENPTLENSSLIQFDFIQELQGTVLSFENGAMILAKSDGSNPVEEVGMVPEGILAASWSPN